MMDFLADTWFVPFLVILTVLVFVHELGHYLAARYCKVRVEVFSVGFGRELFGRTDRHGTRWKFSLIPIGGYVKMFGEMQAVQDQEQLESRMSEADAAVAFNTKSLAQRAFIVFAGPLANFLFAIVILTGMFMTVGQPTTPADVGDVVANSAAERAGFMPGDVIVEIEGSRIDRFEEVIRAVRLYPGVPLKFRVMRDGRSVELLSLIHISEPTRPY